MSNQFENILKRRHNGSMKWEAPYIEKRFQVHIDDNTEIFPMFIADMDYQLDVEIKNQMISLYDNPDFGYFHILDSFYQSIIKWYDKIHHIKLKQEWLTASIGTITSLNLACDMLAREQEIIIMTPVYGPFQNCANVGHKVVLPLLYQNQRYEIDFDNLEDIFKIHDIRVLLICNPHNPGGRAWSKEELKRLVLLCKQYKVIILSDEIHGDIQVSNQKYTSLIEFSDLYDGIMVSTSPNKTFNISGLSTSFMICANPQIKQRYEDYLNHLHIGCNRMGIQMIEWVYTYGEKWYKELIQTIKNNLDIVKIRLKDTDITVMEPDCGFLVWIYLPHIKDVDQFVLDLARETHVFIETGSRFLENYQGWVRINVATSPSLVKEAIHRFVQFYQNYSE